MAQILGYVSPQERAAFDAYALDHGLDVTALANLLIARELQAARLRRIIETMGPAPPLTARAKIVAHAPEATKLAFANHAASVGLKPSRAAAILFRAELEERWLARQVLVNHFDST